jgi:IS30 family transposase
VAGFHLPITGWFCLPTDTNENTNGLVRQYFPKGTDFRTISHAEVREAENRLNDRPRACLNYETPAAVFHRETPTSNCD